ncbi:MAG: hypothetical protein KAS04_03525 [Candidatus Aenigmarchaeota archaeon]|nr:hypothetical protein [Candidatus Aenigmarchaeota archaeon]
MAELINIGVEILSMSQLWSSRDSFSRYGERIKAVIHTLFINNTTHDSGWAPSPDIEGNEYIIQHLDDDTKSQLWRLLRETGSTCPTNLPIRA